MGSREGRLKEYKIIQAHYGENHSFWRVVVSHQHDKLQTVGKFPTKEQAQKYVTHVTQAQDGRHNQW